MEEDFTFGPVVQGVYRAMLSTAAIVSFISPALALWWIGLLLFLGVGLKPFLKRTGLRRIWLSLMADVQRKRHAPHHAEAARRVERRRRDEKLRKARLRNPELPKRW